ncbi:hypothetical protein GCK72_021326 [Caenorhabditis remanei]|uniref:PAN-3 domain-containing protein n=1 Tax=Caenorhabditis remanei TaxID=31234 RepID=A0A6A5GJT6_CAERE|nr:hypothetical protein GCK72_021326 [Caenorhabditis remanei]KAF1754762.1 hypothetical protein GCK72_021326 [Caenorhabditis remanei]
MLKIFGKVLRADLRDTVDPDCVQTCFKAFDCILAYFYTSGRCQLFNFNETEKLEVEETNKADGFFVAFKTTLPNDTCPAYPDIRPVVNIGEDPITWIKSGTTFSRCIGDWKMFRRSNPEITVCMQVYERFLEIYPNADNWQAIWIDGVRNCNWESNPKCNVFEWSDEYTVGEEALTPDNAALSFYKGSTPENCLVVISNSVTSVSLNDVPCGRGSGLELGVACGYQMLARRWTRG